MDEHLTITYVEKPEWKIIGGGIRSHNIQQAGEDHAQSVCFPSPMISPGLKIGWSSKNIPRVSPE
jgi:hypothetical protein